MHRIVHFDLKGAPYRVDYLERVIEEIKVWGATGVLFEWEDTFPYTGGLEAIGSLTNPGGDELYSPDEVKQLLNFTAQKGLVAIQLVQTIGHMEFVLKHAAFKAYREQPSSPAVLCPSKPQSIEIVMTMVDQALEMQPDAQYFHIGADEVWHIGVCQQCQRRASLNPHRLSSLYLEHIQKVILFIKHKRPKLTVLMWDDMLRTIHYDTLKAYKLGELVEPVVWNYSVIEQFKFKPDFWKNYSRLFPQVWAGSAFKGANGSCQITPVVQRYVSNHEAWRQEIKKSSALIKFNGVILTGWSRYDHYATLCELLPMALPSLASCLRLLAKKSDSDVTLISDDLPGDEWPGISLVDNIQKLVVLREKGFNLIHGDFVKTWMNTWQLHNNYTSPVHLDMIARDVGGIEALLISLQTSVIVQLYNVTGRRSAQEWLGTYVTPLSTQLSDLIRSAEHRRGREAEITPAYI